MKTQSPLQLVHHHFSKNEFHLALVILEKLVKEHPNFSLYTSKLEECKTKLPNNKTIISPKIEKLHPSLPPLAKGATVKEKMAYAIKLAEFGNTPEARKIFNELHNYNKKDVVSLVWLARVDLIDQRFADALHKAKVAITMDKEYREAYRIAEQSAIELGKFEEANTYYLSQPLVINPVLPRKRGANTTLPPQYKVPPIIGAGNDYRHILERVSLFKATKKAYTRTVTIIVPVYNRHKILANTLAALTHQTYPKDLTEIIVVDDGSNDAVFDVIKKYESKLNLYYSRQADKGFRVAAARNIGIKCAKGDVIIFIDADILPLPRDIESYMEVMHVSDEAVLIGHRRYVDVSNINDEQIIKDVSVVTQLPNINPNNDVADRKNTEGTSIDWRYPVYEKTNYLIDDLWPFTKGAAGNIAFPRTLMEKAGYQDEDFQAWGCEDVEHCFRFYNIGAYFIPMMDIVSLHQEPLNELSAAPVTAEGDSFRAAGHKVTKLLFSKKCPAPVVRRYEAGITFDIPKVSIYIPAYNASRYIIDAVQSCLNQSFGDLEVCICDDGSSDNTLQLLEHHFSANPKVRWVTQNNGGIGKATNTAINLCRGIYIGQLDADDILKSDAIKNCIAILDKTGVDAVYADCDYIDSKGKYIREGWCGGEYSREWMATGMIATHFRMFRKRTWARTTGCNETIKNAVDLDLWLKLYEKGSIEHIHEVLYSYRWHGENTSIMHRKQQEQNHLKVVMDSLKRSQLDRFWSLQSTGNRLNPREFKIMPLAIPSVIKAEDIIFLIPTCARYSEKTEAVRNTWAKQLNKLGFRYLFLMGKPELRIAEVIDDVLYVPCKDDYESLLLKLVLGYEFMHRNMNFTHVYKIDDDCYPNLDKLVNTILPQLAGKQYVGGATHAKGAKMNNHWHFGKCSDKRFDKPYRFDVAPFEFAKGGYGYFLRKDILPILFEKIDTLKQELSEYIYSYEDVRIAEIMSQHKILAEKFVGYHVILDNNNTLDDNMLIYDIKEASTFYLLEKTVK